MFTALLDTCVRYPSLQWDVLLSFAVENLYRPVWSAVTLEELEYHLKDFPRAKVPAHIEVQPPAEFALNTVSIDPQGAVRAISSIAERSGGKGPQRDIPEILETVRQRYGFDEAVQALQQAL